MTEKRKSPALRFRGYTDDWEQRKLGDVLERRIEQRQQSEEYPRLAFASGQGVIPLSERKTNNREQLTKDEYTKKYLVTELNDIVYNPANVKYGAIDRNKCGRGLISPIYVTFTTNEISGFIERIVTSHDFQQRSLRFEEGTVTKRQSVNPEDLVTLDILVAPKREEQQKIATYFDNLDRLITLHQRKLEKLKLVKKSMLEKMFPKNGSSVPEIRFNGFTDDWEQRKLSDLAEKTYGGGTPTTLNEAYWNGDIPWIQSSDVMDGKLLGVEPRKWITQAGLNNSAAQLIPENSIAIITRVGVGKLAFMPYSYATSQDFLSLSKLNAEPFFTVYACYKELQTGLNAVQGTSIKGITKDELLAKNIMVPRYAEQQQIGAFFKNLDHLITLHQRKVEKLQIMKKTMLEKMFV